MNLSARVAGSTIWFKPRYIVGCVAGVSRAAR
jgi:hypothetical protein